MRFHALVARTDVPLPPPVGPARTQFCLREGFRELVGARRLLWLARLRLSPVVQEAGTGGWPPPVNALAAGSSGAFSQNSGKARVRRWFALRDRLYGRAIQRELEGMGEHRALLTQAEETARQAVTAAVNAYLWLQDAMLEEDPHTEIALPTGSVTLEDALNEAHALLHESGDLVGGLFGCKMLEQDGAWFRRCPVQLAHIPLANSIGFTCRYKCSLCREDFSECPHTRGATYDVVPELNGDLCSLCARPAVDCDHQPGTPVRAVAGVLMTDIELREISLVHRARDPLARITALEVPQNELHSHLGFTPEARHGAVLCHTCMYPCQRQADAPDPQKDQGVLAATEAG